MRAIARVSAVVLLLGLVVAPLARATIECATADRDCCADPGPCSDRSTPCPSMTLLSCCAPGAVLHPSSDALQLATPVAVAISSAVAAPASRPQLAGPARSFDRAPIPPLLLKSVLLV